MVKKVKEISPGRYRESFGRYRGFVAHKGSNSVQCTSSKVELLSYGQAR